MDTLPRELIPKITIYLTPINIANLSYSCSKFSNVFDFDWKEYFYYHLGEEFVLNKEIIVPFNKRFIEKFNQLQPLPFNFSFLKYLFTNRDILREEIRKELTIITKIHLDYKDNIVYNKLIKMNKPIIFTQEDIEDKIYFYNEERNTTFWIKMRFELLLSECINRVIIFDDDIIRYCNSRYKQPILAAIEKARLFDKKFIIILE